MKNHSEPAKPVYCIDEERTLIVEDGYYIIFDGKAKTHRILIAAVAVTPEQLNVNNVLLTLNKSKSEMSKLNLHMFDDSFTFDHNLSGGKPISSILVEFEIPVKGNKITETKVSLGTSKLFKRMTYEQFSSHLKSSEPSHFKNHVYIFSDFSKREIIPKFNSKSIYLPPEKDFIRKLMWMYNFACRNFCLEKEIPYVGFPNTDPFLPDLETSGIFNCPLRNPQAALNNINLTYFLEYGTPYFSEKALADLVEKSKDNIT